MAEFISSNWSEYKVTKKDKYPKGKHYIVLVFGSRVAYNGYDNGSTESCADVYALTERSHLDLFVSEIARTSTQFVFYEVTSLGKATVKVDIDTEV